MQTLESNRIGKFEISFTVMNGCPETVNRVMAECIVIDVDLQKYNGKAIYTAISARFDEVEEGERYPMYYWELERTAEGGTRVKGCKKLLSQVD